MKTMKILAICLIMMAIATATSCVHTATIDGHEWETVVTTETQQWVHQEGWNAPTGSRTIRNLQKTQKKSGVKTVSTGGFVTETTTNTKVIHYNVWGYRTCAYCKVKHLASTSCGCNDTHLDNPFEPSEKHVKKSEERSGEGKFCDYCKTFGTSTKCTQCGHPYDSEDMAYSGKFSTSPIVKGDKEYTDLGNGQFRVSERVPYTDEEMIYVPPVTQDEYDEYFYWEELVWKTNRTFPASGTGTSLEFKDVQLQAGERFGKTKETYIIVYKVDDGTTITRDYDKDEWLRLKDGNKVKTRKWWFFTFFYWVSQEIEMP